MKQQKAAAPAISKTPAPHYNLKQFEQECLDEHNRLRELHGCPALVLNRDLCSFATEWAEKLARKKIMKHREKNKYGENIFMISGAPADGAMTTKYWYEEIAQYDFDKPVFKMGYGHFTQVIWHNSNEIGVGLGTNGGTTIVVANYNPPGNVVNYFKQNVPKLK